MIEQLESKLAGRAPTINPILSGAAPTLPGLVLALLDENAVVTPAGAGSSATPGDGSASQGGAAADGRALTLQSFKDVESALLALDLESETGRRDAISAVLLQGECVLATRILLHPKTGTSDAATARTPMCTELDGLRPALANYFNHMLRLDVNAPRGAPPTVPQHMEAYSFAQPKARDEQNSMLSQLLRFEFDDIEYFAEPGGAGAWFRAQNVGTTVEAVARVNYFCQPVHLERLRDFFGVVLTAIGLPGAPPPPRPGTAQGFSWQTFVDYYLKKLKLAGSVPLLADQYSHMQACSDAFVEALVFMKGRLTTLVRAPDPGSRSMDVALFPADSAPIMALDSLASEINRKRAARGAMAGAFEPHKGTAAVAHWESLRLDDAWYITHIKKPAAAKKAKFGDEAGSSDGASSQFGLSFGMDALLISPEPPAEGAEVGVQPPGNGKGMPPGSLSRSWKWAGGRLIISALSWDVNGLAKSLGVSAKGANAPCWPYHLSKCADKNRLARCDKVQTNVNHADDNSLAHRPIPGFNLEEHAKRFARAASAEEKEGIVKDPLPPAKGTAPGGKGKGGRGAQGRGGRTGSRGMGAQLTELKRRIATMEGDAKRRHGDSEPELDVASPPAAAAAQFLVSLGSPAPPPPALLPPPNAAAPAGAHQLAAPPVLLLQAPGAPPAPPMPPQPHFQAPPPARVSWWRQDQ